MANTSIALVQFHGATLSVTTIDNAPYVAMRPVCEAIGLDWKAQQDRMKRHPVLNSAAVITTSTGTDGKRYDMLMLPLSKLNGWLFGVSVRRVKPELRERLTQYQAECFDVLAGHFGGAALPAPIAPAGIQRWLTTINAQGALTVEAVPTDALVVTPDELPDLITQNMRLFTDKQVQTIAMQSNLRMMGVMGLCQEKTEFVALKNTVRNLARHDLYEIMKQGHMELSLRNTDYKQ